MVQRLLFILALACCAIHSGAQITVRGGVGDAETGKPLYPVSVKNTSTSYGTTTGADGRYSITAREGDQLEFSFIGYESRTWTVRIGSDMALHGVTYNTTLKRRSIQLKEFEVSTYKLYQRDSAERASTYQQVMETEKAGVMSPVSYFYTRFSKKYNQIWDFQKRYKAYEKEKFVDLKYTPALVSQLTGFTGDTLAHFMNAYPMDFDFARTASDLEIKAQIRYNFKEFVRSKGWNIQPPPIKPKGQ